jgi:hypothetical protein
LGGVAPTLAGLLPTLVAPVLEGVVAVFWTIPPRGEALETEDDAKPVTTLGDPAIVVTPADGDALMGCAIDAVTRGDPTTGKSSRDDMAGTGTLGEAAIASDLDDPCRF